MKPSVFSAEISDLLPTYVNQEQCLVAAVDLYRLHPSRNFRGPIRTCTDAE
ncbi:hypothetical protein [Synechococcus sp. MIT S9508]|uniref:hypothetical protein n=1 Tax=Synechococcus sp. MIT S9508 TaxID=1801629 RepID=UPI000AAF84AF|nr:hypothetical protein [Synechococcus sp. MIT S9508]